MSVQHIDHAPSIPFDLATVSGGAQRANGLDLDLMARITEDAGRAAADDRTPYVDPFDASPAMREVAQHPEGGLMVAAARLWRAAFRGARWPAAE